MPDDIPPLSESLDEAILRFVPDLHAQYRQEVERHKAEKAEIERLRRIARNNLKRWFRSPLRETKLAALEAEYLERSQGEADRHARVLGAIRDTIRDHARPGWDEAE